MKQNNEEIERFRVGAGPMGTDSSYGNNGYFWVRLKNGKHCTVIASDRMGWEHVSVSFHMRTPTWDEMCEIKDLFWAEDEWVAQFHPAKDEYVNNHPHCLHLWKPIGQDMPKPLKAMVGV